MNVGGSAQASNPAAAESSEDVGTEESSGGTEEGGTDGPLGSLTAREQLGKGSASASEAVSEEGKRGSIKVERENY